VEKDEGLEAEALCGSLDTGYGGLDDATSSEGR